MVFVLVFGFLCFFGGFSFFVSAGVSSFTVFLSTFWCVFLGLHVVCCVFRRDIFDHVEIEGFATVFVCYPLALARVICSICLV